MDPSSQGLLMKSEEQLDAAEFIDKVATDMQHISESAVLADLAKCRNREGMWSKPFVWKGLFKHTELSKVAVRI
ncbi:hypothetical protein PR048_021487 [Dryococelus australis]|uniref:Uncharacterized protein n=1 Tax=Dryococelus australis TaxID=614101 RepID=A0ABQ9GYC1_9NEOP|nr:hypothetical protein PR048_021487 [Dryococelus australis]